MVPVSVVIITKNEAEHIGRCLIMARLITDDIIVVDNGSTDETVSIAAELGCRVYQENWNGYGANKNKGIKLAKHDWILSIDADEVPDIELVDALHRIDLSNSDTVYDIRFRSYFGNKLIRFGSWGRDHHLRLFNRGSVKWSEPEVHETLVLPDNIIRKKLKGHLHHYPVNDIYECTRKAVFYAKLSARQYMLLGKKATFLKLYLSPAFGFIKNYIFRLGFLDGLEGLDIAVTMFKNTSLKYYYLKQYEQGKLIAGKRTVVSKNLVVEY